MRSRGNYCSQFVCVCVCLSLWCFIDLQRVDFAENALFKSYGVICLPRLPPTLPVGLSTDRRNSSAFFTRQSLCTLSNSFCRTTDLSLFCVNELLSFLACPGCAYHVLAGLAHVVTLRIAQLHKVCILVVTPVQCKQYIVPYTMLAKCDL